MEQKNSFEKTEEIGKYDDMKNINIVDYSSHRTNKILNQYDLEEFKKLLQDMYIEI